MTAEKRRGRANRRGSTSSRPELVVLGSGDAFGSGGRNQAAFLVNLPTWAFLLDCGPTTLVSMKRLNLDPTRIGAILLSHLHADHAAGIPFFFLQYQFLTRRQEPLIIAGPPGTEQCIEGLWGLMYKETRDLMDRRFAVEYVELTPKKWTRIGPIEVLALEVVHHVRDMAFGLKVKAGRKLVGYSGDTEWTDNLIELADGCDLFICESYRYDQQMRFHMSYHEIRAHRAELRCKRLLLTHLHADALARLQEFEEEVAVDGMRLRL